jgi:signal peptide peptidase SppA
MIWDIPSTAGLAIQMDMLPAEAPQIMQGQAMPDLSAKTERIENIAVIDIRNVITPYSNILSLLFGGTNIETLEAEFSNAMEDPNVKGIILKIDSPGGLITGVQEFADTIYRARGTKPIVAYSYGNAASAAYWIASAADQIVAGPTTFQGSIGVAMAVPKTEDSRWVRFVSSNAPRKNISASSKEGQESIQARIDAMEAEFISAIARHRGLPEEQVLSEFGQGDVLSARTAMQVGMTDLVGGFNDALALVSTLTPKQKGVVVMAHEKETPSVKDGNSDMIQADHITAAFIQQRYPEVAKDLIAQGQAQAAAKMETAHKDALTEEHDKGLEAGATAERERIMKIEDVAMPGYEEMVSKAKADGKTTAEELAMQILAVEKQKGSTALENMKADAENVPAIEPSVDPAQAHDVSADPSLPAEDRAKATWDKDPKVRDEFKTLEAYTAFVKAEEAGQVRILKR